MATLQARQLALIERMAALDPPPCFIGGWAEDAVLAERATRPHVDLDWLLPRSELEERLAQAARFGFRSGHGASQRRASPSTSTARAAS